MRAKRRCVHGKRLRRSPLKEYPTRDFSAEATKGNLGEKIAKSVTPESPLDIIPVGKAAKVGKALYKFLVS